MALPDDRQWRQIVNERCQPVVLQYLGGKFDPDGRYRVGALKPSPAKWAEGDRELRCGVQSASRSGALLPLTGRAADSDQAAVNEPGTCLAIDGRTIGDPVDCAGPHAVETVGIVDLAGKFPDAYPAVGDQDSYLQPECARIANEYAGSARGDLGQGPHRLLGQHHRGVLERRQPQGQLQPRGAAARPERFRARHRAGTGRRRSG